MQLLIVFVVFVLVLLFGIVVRVVASDLNESDRPVAFEVKAVSEDGDDDGSPTGSISPSRVGRGVHRGVRRGVRRVGEVSHYTKMHSRTRYRI